MKTKKNENKKSIKKITNKQKFKSAKKKSNDMARSNEGMKKKLFPNE